MKTRICGTILWMMLACQILSGCGKSDDAAAADDGQTEESTEGTATGNDGTVTLRVWAEEANFDNLTKMIESFKEEYSGQADFDIVLEQNADANTKDNVLGDIYNAADIFSFADDQVSGLVAAGALAPVADADRIRAANVEDAVEAASVNDVLYAYPMTADNGYFLYYDKRYISDEDVKTLDGLLEAAAAQGKTVAMDWSSGWYLYAFFGGTGLEFGINEDGVTNHCNWNASSGNIKGTDVAQAMLEIAANPGFASMTDEDFIKGAQNGTVAAGVSGVWNAVAVKDAWGEGYGAMKLPTYTCAGRQIQMTSFKGYKMMGVNYYSPNKDWALKLADWFTNEENQTLRLVERNQGPSNINAASSPEVAKIPAIQAVMEQAEFGVLQRVGNSYWDACSSFGNTMAAGNPANTDLQELMDILNDGITMSAAQ